MFVPVTDIRKIAELYVAGLLWHNPHYNFPTSPEHTPPPLDGGWTIDKYVEEWTRAFAPHMQSGVYGYVTEE